MNCTSRHDLKFCAIGCGINQGFKFLCRLAIATILCAICEEDILYSDGVQPSGSTCES